MKRLLIAATMICATIGGFAQTGSKTRASKKHMVTAPDGTTFRTGGYKGMDSTDLVPGTSDQVKYKDTTGKKVRSHNRTKRKPYKANHSNANKSGSNTSTAGSGKKDS